MVNLWAMPNPQHLPFGPIVWSVDGRNNLIEPTPGSILGLDRIATIVVARPQIGSYHPRAEDFYRLLKREKPVAFRATATMEGDDTVHLYTFYASQFSKQ